MLPTPALRRIEALLISSEVGQKLSGEFPQVPQEPHGSKKIINYIVLLITHVCRRHFLTVGSSPNLAMANTAQYPADDVMKSINTTIATPLNGSRNSHTKGLSQLLLCNMLF